MKKLQECCNEFIVPQRDKPKEFGGDIPWCRIEDIEGKYLNGTNSGKFVTKETVKKMNLKVIPKGSVICSCSASLGVQAILTTSCITNQTFIGIVPSEEISKEFLYYFLKSKTNYFKKIGTGTTIPYISRKKFEELLIPKSSINEQDKIVKTLEKAELIIEKRKQQLQQLDELVKSRFIELFGEDDYPKVLFEDVCVFLRNGANIKQTKGAGGYPITRIETLANDMFNIDRLGYADITDLEKYQGYILRNGDILISHINSVAYLGRAVQYRGQHDSPIIHGMNLLCARIVDLYNPTYIEWHFKTPMAKEYISTITKKAVNQASITSSDLKKMKVPNPPKEMQDEFAEFVKEVEKSKFVVQKALDEAQTLFDSLMQEYFG